MINLSEALKKIFILSELNSEELSLITKILKIKTFSKGQTIILEGEKSADLYFLLEGSVLITKEEPVLHHPYILGELDAGEIFGDMSFIGFETRTATISTKMDCTVGVLAKEDLFKAGPLGHDLYDQLIKLTAQTAIKRLNQVNIKYLESLRREKEALKTRINLGEFFILIIVAFGLSSVSQLLLSHIGLYQYTFVFDWGYLLLLFVLVVSYIIRSKYSFEFFGLTINNWKRSLIEGTSISVLASISIYLIAVVYIKYLHGSFNYNYHNFYLILLFYPFHAFLQEFMARGVIQSSLKQFYEDKKGIFSIVITSFLFAIFHLHKGVSVALIVFIASLCLGWLYNRHKNLIGVTVLHYVLGVVGHVLGVIP